MNALLPRRWWALLAVSLATFLAFLDNNVVNVALPAIQRHLGLSLSGLEWVVSSYILVLSGLMLVGGRLADLFGRRLLVLVGISVFTLASLLAGLAGDATVLITARALQGVGAAAMLPPMLAIIQELFTDERERSRALGTWMAVGALALALGPFLGGVISQHLTWGWIFLINVPFGVVTFALAVATLPRMRQTTRARLDVPGLLTSATALFTVTYALIEGHDRGWTSAAILTCFAVSAVAAAAFVALEQRRHDPMVDLAIFRSRVFSGGMTILMLWGFGVMGIYFFTALYLQNVLGLSPTTAGASLIPMALAMAVTAPLAPALSRRIGTNVAVALGAAIMVAAMVGLAGIGAHGHVTDLLLPFIAAGVGSGLIMTPVNDSVLGVLPPVRAAAGGAVLNAVREVSGLLGITIFGAILSGRASQSARHGATVVQSFLDGYRFTLVVAAGIVALSVPLALHTLRPKAVTAPEEEPLAQREPVHA